MYMYMYVYIYMYVHVHVHVLYTCTCMWSSVLSKHSLSALDVFRLNLLTNCTFMYNKYSCIVQPSVFTWQWLKYLRHNENVSDNIWLKINLSISQGELVADICKVSRKHIHILTTAGDCCQVKSSQTIGQNTSAAGSRETKTTDVQ